MKKLLALPLVAAALIVAAPPAMAGPPSDAEGEWTYGVTGIDFRYAGNTTFAYGTEHSYFTGTFDGESDDEFVVICHEMRTGMFNNWVRGTIDFTGSVEGRDGTMTMKFVGKQTSTTCDPSDAIWNGTWTVVGDEGDLADLHGQGTWTGPSFDLDYAGRIHFD
ncbi:hypothetical protein [Demequina mangrovi]|uniref:Uncharacterized protein n=1 Tax=Demequina mangrovi TaxID=1043493 RepID=A0A1H6V1S1_9MICO|nr:hypothetical protein [Demequina mangrovi]SEI96924.1 hypothetical protein SAMN05421637_0588 [Demequina mangrovi]